MNKASLAQLGNLNSKIHGIYSQRLFNREEKLAFKRIMARFEILFPGNLRCEFMAIAVIQLLRAIEQENLDAYERIDRILRHHLKELVAPRRAVKEEKKPKSYKFTAEEQAKILEADAQAEAERKGQ